MSDEARQMLAYDVEPPKRVCFFSLVHRHNLYRVMADMANMVCHDVKHASWLLRLRTGSGRWRWFEVRAHNQLEATQTIRLYLYAT